MSLKSDLVLYAVKNTIGKCIYNEGEGLLDNSRGKQSPDWITRAWNWFTNKAKEAFDYLMSDFASIFKQAAMTVYQFDFARTDEMIWADIDATNKGFAQQLGRMGAAQLFRSTALGLSKRAKMTWPTIDPVVFANADEENAEELKATITGALAAIRSGITRNLMNLTYMSGRALMGLSPKKYTEPWSLAATLENGVEWFEENIPIIGGFFRGFYEQAEDDFFEIGFLMASGVQSQYAMSRAAINDSKGKERIVKFYPDRSDTSNFTFVSGREEDIKNTISTQMVQEVSMASKSVGIVAMTTLDQSMKATMGLRMITCYFNASEGGGSTLPDGKRAPQKILEIKNIKATVDYEKLKTYLKPIDGGHIKVIAFLSDGHQLVGFFSTEPEGKSYFRPIIENICVGDLVRFQHIPAAENPLMRPHLGRFKPASFTMQIRKETLDPAKKQFIDANGKMFKVAIRNRIKLNTTDKPQGIDDWITNPFTEITT